MHYQAVFFDCDGTLVDTEMMIVDLVRDICADHGCAVDLATAVEMVVGISWAATYAAIGAHLRAHGRAIDDAAVSDELHHRLAPRHFAAELVIPSSVALLRALAERVPIDVVSGSTAEQVERHLANCGVRPLVRHVIADGMAARGKPDGAPYLLAAERAGLDVDHCLAIEDSVAGVSAAVAAGVAVIGLDRHGLVDLAAAGADLVVSDLALIDPASILQANIRARAS